MTAAAGGLAEVAARDSQDIKSMFSWAGTAFDPANNNNVNLYTVRFYNSKGTAEYVTVDSELPAGVRNLLRPDQRHLGGPGREGLRRGQSSPGYVTTQQPGKNSYAALSGGDPEWALEAITGKWAGDFALNPANVAAAWNQNELVVLESDSKPARTDIVANHCYAMVNYNPSVVSQGKSMPYELFNPWGTNSAGNAPGGMLGLFYATSNVISQNFDCECYGAGAAAEAGIHSHLTTQAATDLVPGKLGYLKWCRPVLP